MNDATETAPNGRVLLEMRDNVVVMTLNDPVGPQRFRLQTCVRI